MNWVSPFSLSRAGILGMNRRNIEYIGAYNERRFFPRVDNKLTTKLLATEAGLAVPGLIDVVETQHAIEQVEDKLAHLTAFVAKPAQGSGGKGILVITEAADGKYVKASGAEISMTEVKRHLTNTISGLHSLGGRPDIAFLEELVKVDPMFNAYSHEGVPDIRLIVFQGFPVMGMLRLATKASDGKANLHQGAIGVGIDLATGKAIQAVMHEQVVTHHPDTGADLRDIAIPDWDSLLLLAARCFEVSELGYLGCDIVIDRQHGPLILELNARPGLSIQIANNRGILPRLRHLQNRKQKELRHMALLERVEYAKTTLANL